MKKKILVIFILSMMLIITLVSADLIYKQKLTLRTNFKNGNIYLGENRTYITASISLSVDKIRENKGLGSIIINFGKGERMVIKLLPKEYANIEEWSDEKITVSQSAVIKYTNIKKKIRTKERVELRYIIYPRERKVSIEFPWEESNAVLSIENASYIKCIRTATGIECIRY